MLYFDLHDLKRLWHYRKLCNSLLGLKSKVLILNRAGVAQLVRAWDS